MPKRILWLDNDHAYLHGYQQAIQHEGYMLDYVTSIREAERRIYHSNYDLLILDVMLTVAEKEETDYPPKLTDDGKLAGLVFYRRNKNKLLSKRIPVMVFTIREEREVIDTFAREGLPREQYVVKHDMEETREFLRLMAEAISTVEEPPRAA